MTTVVSTFSGGGGSSLGYKLAGCDVRLGVEWDADAVETYRRNFPITPIFHGDIATLTVERVCELAGLSAVDELDILDGSPPCQGFSMAGKRDASDRRNRLFEEYARLLRGLRPRAFIMENVRGMVIGDMRAVFDEVIAALRECGYRVKARVLNAMWYGVPQSRERVIFVGIRNNLYADPTHPRPTTSRPTTVREALAGVRVGEAPHIGDGRYGVLWRRIRPGKSAANVLNGSGYSSCIKIHPDRPSPTIMKMQGRETSGGYATLCHWSEPRALSTEEAQRLASFPDDFVFTGNYQQRWARIGNSVPPLLMRAIAAHVRGLIDR